MAFLAKGKKQDLVELAEALDVEIGENFKILEIKDAITKSPTYEPEFTKECLNRIISDRKELELRADREKENERLFELEKLKIQASTSSKSDSVVVSSSSDSDMPKLELHKLIPNFDPKTTDMSLFLELFEKQLSLLKIPISKYVLYLVSLLPADVANLIAKESSADAQNYENVKQILLKRFKLSAEKFRQMFSQHRKNPESTWRDFYFDLQNYFDGWIKESKVTTFDELKDLIVADQIKKKTPPEYKDHFLDQWCDWTDPLQLADKLDAYEAVRSIRNKTNHTNFNYKQKQSNSNQWRSDYARNHKLQHEPSLSGFPSQSRRETGALSNSRRSPISNDRLRERKVDESTEDKNSVYCFGCGKPGYIKSKCPDCSPPKKTSTNHLKAFASVTKGSPMTLMDATICGVYGRVCADTGSTHSIAGAYLFSLFKENNLPFQKTELTLHLANGSQTVEKCLTTQVPVYLEGRKIITNFIILPNATKNRTLLGTDFLETAGVVLDLANKNWFFHDKPKEKYPFGEELPLTPVQSEEQIQSNICQLREEEGITLDNRQKKDLSDLIVKFDTVFKLGGGATPLIEHHIKTGDHPPVAVPPYRMSPAKKELLKKELDDLLEKNIIEECESAYGAPVVLIPKPNGDVRLCIDYRKLNAITIPDVYPLPRMDDILQDAKHTAFMSTIDLKSGYHQVNVYPPDRDKTAFVCPFGTYRFNRMPFGLRNAPATFQRLMDVFRRDLPVLAYLDDIIVLSPTFDQHLRDLEAVFTKLIKFNLCANRDKCTFSCSKVKYLGLWITPQGIEVDSEKVSSIQNIPPPKNIKQLQSFLQTCSWYRKFIPNFSELSRPLSNLTKKNTPWTWTSEAQTAFNTLKKCLVTPPILKQADFTQPFTVRTDASNYALGAVLLQGQGQDERPIEYASRLLKSAERNYSTTEREALAVVWALNKFRGYVDGQEITIASDHQPLKWLMTLKSPSGRLSRWALQLQAFNLKIEYIPGKINVVADMLSRPSYAEGETSEVCAITVDMPSRKSSDIRKGQLEDEELKQIINSFENMDKDENFANYTSRGYLMNQGILYRYSPESEEEEEAQLVVPVQERERILQEYHDAPTAGHYGVENTYKKIASRYYFRGMKKFISEYIKTCPACNRYKPTTQKPAGLLRTPAYAQRFETLAIDLFGPLPETSTGKKWIFIVEDTSTKWVELFALSEATAANCAKILIEEVFLRYGLPRRLISDNGPQFVSAVMQLTCDLLEITQDLIPVYHPQANPAERKNRDLKPRLAILVGEEHASWEDKLPLIRFAMNTSVCDTTGQTAAYLQFGRQLRTADDIKHDIRQVIDNDNFVPEITPYLKRFANSILDVKDRVEQKQDRQKENFDRRRRQKYYKPGDKVWVTIHPISRNNRSRKFMPKREGPYLILTLRSPTTYEIADPANPDQVLGTYHVSALKDYHEPEVQRDTGPVVPLRKRGRPKKLRPGSEPRRHTEPEGEPVTHTYFHI